MAWRHASRGTHTGGPLLGVPPTGKALAWSGTATLRLAGERVEEISGNVDLFAVYRPLGVVSAPTGG